MFCSTRCKNAAHQNYPYQKARAEERKLALIKKLGGQCVRCGYDKNMAALVFHHKSGKLFKIDARTLANRSEENVEAETRKCELICTNCHAEEHHPDMDL